MARQKEPIVYCPAHLKLDELEPTVRLFTGKQVPEKYRLRVGGLGPTDAGKLHALVRQTGLEAKTEYTGRLDDDALVASYATASHVVRIRSNDNQPDNWAAASGPLVLALSGGCAVASNDPRGSADCLLEVGGIDLRSLESNSDISEHLSRFVHDEDLTARISAAGRNHIAGEHSPEKVGEKLRRAWLEG